MATLQTLCRMGVLRRHDPELDPSELEERIVYIYPDAGAWLNGVESGVASPFGHHMTPKEQAYERLAAFCAGYEIEIPRQIRCLRHVDAGIWELKTLDVRMFGWFAAKDVFILAVAMLTDNVKQNELYNNIRDLIILMRDNLGLDEPKFIPGDQINDLISNCD